MSVSYQAVLWNRQKRIYDLTLLAGVLLYIATYIVVTALTKPHVSQEALIIRSTGTAAILLLHIILSIGPLCRLEPRFLPLLYNRRHLGVTMFLLALVHAVLSVMQFHAFGEMNPLKSILVSNGHYDSVTNFPFQALGLVALFILFLMAATSHDFWLANLTAPVWKALHMLVYVAYGLLILHVALGVLQTERQPALTILLGVGFLWIVGLHVLAASKEHGLDRNAATEHGASDSWVDVCAVEDIEEDRAKIVSLAGERVAIFRYYGKVSAVSNVCQHQNGPLGEGRVIDGCITCPWHGYQYRPEDGASPPPFTEKIPTFNVRVEGGRVLVDPQPNPPGTPTDPAPIDPQSAAAAASGMAS